MARLKQRSGRQPEQSQGAAPRGPWPARIAATRRLPGRQAEPDGASSCSQSKGYVDGPGRLFRVSYRASRCLRTCPRPARALGTLLSGRQSGTREPRPMETVLRKEVIQPQVPLRLPCYDFTPVAELTVAGCPLLPGWRTVFGWTQLPWCDGRCVQGPGTYSPRHAVPRLLAIPA